MATAAIDPRQQAHELIDRMATSQVSAVVGLLETMLDPASLAIANAPYEDEEISEEETLAVTASKEWLKHNKGIANEEILADFGLTAEDFERMGALRLKRSHRASSHADDGCMDRSGQIRPSRH